MNAKHIQSRFAEMGARLKVQEVPSSWRRGDRVWIDPVDFAVDIRRDGAGEFFELRVPTHLRARSCSAIPTRPAGAGR